MTEAKQTAQTIVAQIASGRVRQQPAGGRWAMGSWGFRNPMSDTDALGQHSLIFQVSGRNFTGKVKVTLMHNDTYTVSKYTYKMTDWEQVQDDVYCEELAQVLDTFIEERK